MSAPTDDGLCEWCGELNNGSTFSPFCSEACMDNAETEDAEHDEAAARASISPEHRDDAPVELPRDVFLLLLDAHREQLRGPILRAFTERAPQRQRYLDEVDATIGGWRVRYECAVDREGAVAIPVTRTTSHSRP